MQMTRDPKFDAYVFEIHNVLDRLDYYHLLGVKQQSGVSEIRKAFFAIAAKFHPDRNRDADEKIQLALYDIFKRLNEAYRILCNAEHRQLYNANLAEGKTRFEKSTRAKKGPQNQEDSIKNLQARQFYRQAVQELKNGNLAQAQLHIQVAITRERGNKAISQLANKITEAKQAQKKK
jgi:curved DNA-binding protein CbpA